MTGEARMHLFLACFNKDRTWLSMFSKMEKWRKKILGHPLKLPQTRFFWAFSQVDWDSAHSTTDSGWIQISQHVANCLKSQITQICRGFSHQLKAETTAQRTGRKSDVNWFHEFEQGEMSCIQTSPTSYSTYKPRFLNRCNQCWILACHSQSQQIIHDLSGYLNAP